MKLIRDIALIILFYIWLFGSLVPAAMVAGAAWDASVEGGYGQLGPVLGAAWLVVVWFVLNLPNLAIVDNCFPPRVRRWIGDDRN